MASSVSGVFNTKQINELTVLAKLNNGDLVLVDHNNITYGTTVDTLLGYIRDEINGGGSSSSGKGDTTIRVIPIGTDIPEESRPVDFYYLKEEDEYITEKSVYTTYFEDNEKNRHFYYTGKNAIKGLKYPDFYYKNTGYTWAKILNYKLTNNAITSHLVEKILVFLNPTVGSNRPGVFELSIYAKFSNGRFDRTESSATLKKLYYDDSSIYTVKLAETPYRVGTETRYSLSVWLPITNIAETHVDVLSSHADNYTPENAAHGVSCYTLEGLTTSNAINAVNVVTDYSTIEATMFADAHCPEFDYEDRLDVLEYKTRYTPWQYVENTIHYSVAYGPTVIDTFETIVPTTMSSSTNETISRIDLTNKCVKVTESGMYRLQFREGYLLDTDESSDIEISVYKNDTKIDELTLIRTVDSKKLLTSSLGYICHLALTDSIYVKAKWSNKDITIKENNSLLVIESLSYD